MFYLVVSFSIYLIRLPLALIRYLPTILCIDHLSILSLFVAVSEQTFYFTLNLSHSFNSLVKVLKYITCTYSGSVLEYFIMVQSNEANLRRIPAFWQNHTMEPLQSWNHWSDQI